MSEQPPVEPQFVDDAHRYSLDSRIATGGMGEVWRGTDHVLGRSVAVKLLKAEYADHPTFRSRFETEARHAAALLHPGVAAVYDFGEASAGDGSGVDRPYLVMELVDGKPLSALLTDGRALDPEVARDLLAQAADAIGAAHTAGIVHRDVKPGNLMVTPDRQVKITDFGIARATEGMALTETGQVMGTPQYLSPEQAQGGTATPASDVYSLGVVAWECLAGRRPFVRETAVATALAHLREPVPDLPDSVPPDLAGVVTRAMAKSPEDRFPDANAFAAALRDPSSVAPIAAAGAGALVGMAGMAGMSGAAAAGDDATQVMGAVSPPVTTTTSTTAGGPGPGRRVPWGWILLAVAIVAGIILVAVLAGAQDGEPDVPEPTTSEGPREQEPSEEPTSETTSQEPSPSPTPSEDDEEPEEEEEEPEEQPSETLDPSLPTESESPASQDPSPTQSSAPADQGSPTVASSTSPSPAAPSSSAASADGGTGSGSDGSNAAANSGEGDQ